MNSCPQFCILNFESTFTRMANTTTKIYFLLAIPNFGAEIGTSKLFDFQILSISMTLLIK